MDGSHCDWPGIKCRYIPECRVASLVCEAELCQGGRLPGKIELKDLKYVKLKAPNITGDIKVFAGLPEIWKLHLEGTQVHGDLATIPSGVRIFEVRGTQVSGDLRDLAHHDLHHVDLSYTKVFGQLRGLLSGQEMYNLVSLKLSGTAVTGDLHDLLRTWGLSELDLSHTRGVTGQMTEDWRGKLNKLITLKLQNSSIRFAPHPREREVWLDHRTLTGQTILPRLKYLDLTDCPVKSPLQRLLLPLAMSPMISIKLRRAQVFGEIPKMRDVPGEVDGHLYETLTYPLANYLLTLDLSENNLIHLQDLPVRPHAGRIFLRNNQGPLKVAPGLFRMAVKEQVILDLAGTQLFSQTRPEAARLLQEGTLKSTQMYAYRDVLAGFACKDLTNTDVRVTPSKFLPQELCRCLPGWYGTGTNCQACPANSFSDEMGCDFCKSCPANSTAPRGSSKMSDCRCAFGSLHDGSCTCDKHHALQQGECVLCSKLHLQCNITGSHASLAPPDVNHIRLKSNAKEAHRCLPPAVSQRCPGGHHCGVGYGGTLCASCAEGFWAKGGTCKPCAQESLQGFEVRLLALGLLALLLAASFLAYRRLRARENFAAEALSDPSAFAPSNGAALDRLGPSQTPRAAAASEAL
eukprot:Skav202244  [mRNA]  locus=scaffold1417:147804:153185:+ [translate_table: standard]